MAKYLLPGTAQPNWRLHVTEDPKQLEQRLLEAHESGGVVAVKASVPDQLDDLRTVYVNPAQLGWWAVVELPDADS